MDRGSSGPPINPAGISRDTVATVEIMRVRGYTGVVSPADAGEGPDASREVVEILLHDVMTHGVE